MDRKEIIQESLHRAKEFLQYQVNAKATGDVIKKCSAHHDVSRYPDMCLPATYNATHALILLGAYEGLETDKRQVLVDFFNDFQQPDGTFHMKQMKEDEIWKGKSISYSWDYIHSHITNYTMGAIKSLGFELKYPLSFLEPYQDPDCLLRWLEERDMSDPWLEGNNIVNLASFLIAELEGKDDRRLKELMDIFFHWHDKHQDPATGYWGTDHSLKPAGIMEGMAGAAHNYHLYFYYNRAIPCHKPIVDYCLEFVKGNVKTSCLDVDVVDILSNMIPYGYRTEEIKEELGRFALKLVEYQNEDGGFADEKTNGVRRMDGWVRGYFEPQGLSNCFATWFRCITLAMIMCVLYPEEADRYHFRNTIGIGYYNKNYLK